MTKGNKKGHAGLIIFILILVLVIGGGTGFYFYQRQQVTVAPYLYSDCLLQWNFGISGFFGIFMPKHLIPDYYNFDYW